MKIRHIVEAAGSKTTLGGFPVTVLNIEDQGVEEHKNLSPGWMLKQDPQLAKKVKDAKRGYQALKKWAGKPVPKDDQPGVAEATGDERFDTMMSRMQREPQIPDPQMPPTDVRDLYQWAVKNNKPYHKTFATWANREGYKSVAQALQKAGDLDSDALDYWTPEAWKAWHGPDSNMPSSMRRERIPEELRDYLETVFDAYDNIVFDWPTEYRQIGEQGMAEALKLDAPQQAWSRPEMQDYLTRIKTGTQTKADKFRPIIHGSNIKAITKDDSNTEWDLDDLASQITTRPKQILGTNAKMAKSKKEGAITYDLTLPALSGIVVDEDTGEFVEIKTCPGAGECQLICYARKGGYRMFPASSMSAAQALNFLVNDPAGYMDMFNREVKAVQARARNNGIKLLVRIHDAGDFFSKEYYNLAMDVARDNPDAKFYFYTKMGEIATDTSAPPNVVSQFSSGARSREVKTVNVVRGAGQHVKDAVTLPKDMFRGLFKTDAKGKYVKDAEGRTQVASDEAWQQFKQKLAATYKIDPASIITYDQMVRIPEGPQPRWNVVVFPAGHGDLGAPRLDVQNQFLMFH